MIFRLAMTISLAIGELAGQASQGLEARPGRTPVIPPLASQPVYQRTPARPAYQQPANPQGQAAYERLRQMQEEQRRRYEQQVRNNFDSGRAAAQRVTGAHLNDGLNQYQQAWNTLSPAERNEMRRSGALSPEELRRMIAEIEADTPAVDPVRPDFENGAGANSLNNLSKVEETLKELDKSNGCTPAIQAQIAELKAKRDRYRAALRDIESAYADANKNATAGKDLADRALVQAGVEALGSTADTMYSMLDAVTSIYKPKFYKNLPSQGDLNRVKKLGETAKAASTLGENGAADAKAGLTLLANVLPTNRAARNAIKEGGGALIDAGDKLGKDDGGAAVGAAAKASSEALKYAKDTGPANAVAGAGTLTQAGSDAMKGNYIQAASRAIAGGAQTLSAGLPNDKRLEAITKAGTAVANYDDRLKKTTDNYYKSLDDAQALDGVLGSSLRSIAERRKSTAAQLQAIESQLSAAESRCTQILLP